MFTTAANADERESSEDSPSALRRLKVKFQEPTGVLHTSGDSTSDLQPLKTDGPLWMEDSPSLRRNNRARDNPGLPRDPPEVTDLFNNASSAEKGIRALMEQQALDDGDAADIASFILRNDGKLDQSKVGDYLGGSDALPRETLQLLLAALNLVCPTPPSTHRSLHDIEGDPWLFLLLGGACCSPWVISLLVFKHRFFHLLPSAPHLPRQDGLPLDSALRKMVALIRRGGKGSFLVETSSQPHVSGIRLPGESQKIDRIIEQFATRWVEANPGVVDHVDTAQVIAFSLVMLNVDAHNENIKRDRKMTLIQEIPRRTRVGHAKAYVYISNLRNICKDGSSPDSEMLTGLYTRVCRQEWQVEERAQMTILHEGWLYKVSSMEAIVSPRRVYAILSTRSLFLYREVRSTPSEGCMTPVRLSTSSSGCVDVWQEQDQEPIAYLRVEGVFCRQLSQQQNPKRFVVRLASDARDSTDGRMTLSKHNTHIFAAETERETRSWVRAMREVTMSDDSIAQKNASFSAVEIKRRSKSLSPGACRARASSANLSASSRSGDLMETSSASYSERELRSSTSREKYQLEASLKMLERKYAVLHKRKYAGVQQRVTSDHPLDSSRSSDHGDSSRSEMASSDPSEQSKPGEEEAGDERLSAPVQPDSSPTESWAGSDEGEVEGVGSFDHASKALQACGELTKVANTAAESVAHLAGRLAYVQGNSSLPNATQAAAVAVVQATRAAALARGSELSIKEAVEERRSFEEVVKGMLGRAGQSEEMLLAALIVARRAEKARAAEVAVLRGALQEADGRLKAGVEGEVAAAVGAAEARVRADAEQALQLARTEAVKDKAAAVSAALSAARASGQARETEEDVRLDVPDIECSTCQARLHRL
ncbi:MAG: hypothetical protein SGPRY_000563 [Prymnesium sp.]